MKLILRISLNIITGFLILFITKTGTQLAAQNAALHFDGGNDFITLSPINGFQPDDDFTVEMWFRADQPLDCNGYNSRVLFSMIDGNTNEIQFEMRICNTHLFLNYYSGFFGPLNFSIPLNQTIAAGVWHHISVYRLTSGYVHVFFDCVSLWDNDSCEPLKTNKLKIGQGISYIQGEDFKGTIDEFRFWNKAVPPTMFGGNCQSCVPSAGQNGLIAYWKFDEGIANGNNQSILQVADSSPYGNDGDLSSPGLNPPGFNLNGTQSNFIASTAPFSGISPLNANIVIAQASNQQIPVSEICIGTPVHFSVIDPMTGNSLQLPSNYSIEWQYSDDGGYSYQSIPANINEFAGTAFVVAHTNQAIQINCDNHPTGFVNRIFRFKVEDDTGACLFAVSDPLKICCPVTGPYIQVNNQGFPNTNLLCEGTVIQFDLTIMNTGLPAPSTDNYVTIGWYVNINGVVTPLTGPGYDNQTNILYPETGTMTLTAGYIYFYAVVGNCACPSGQAGVWINVKAQPICGTIKPADQNPLIPASTPDHYYICPGLSTTLEVDQPFANCNMIWEYMFPSDGTWHPTNGTGNHAHNTNILPQISPPPPNSPYLWPAGETCIKYRIKCLPLNHPNSACAPCYSNEITICLIDTPQKPVIDADPNPFCFGSYSELSVLNPEPGINYTWYHNGILFGNGNPIQTVSPGNYWVFASDPYGCHWVKSDKMLVKTCVVIPVISCPEPLCPCIGDEILLSAALSQSTCSSNLTFQWSWDSGQLVNVNGSELTHIPAPAGTTYTVIVTDAYGCSASKQTFVMPCDCSTSFTCGTSTVTFDYGYSGLLVTYGTVVGANNRCWLDRNLGASQVATSSTDANAYGDLFQWGRLADGHQIRTSPATATLSNSDVPGHGDFILAANSPFDWRSPINNNLWQGVLGINNPCPTGFRLPTESEWETERQSWISNDAAGAFLSSLKLPAVGFRYFDDGFISLDIGTNGNYWSSTTISGCFEGSSMLQIGSTNIMGTAFRASGISVRCIMD